MEFYWNDYTLFRNWFFAWVWVGGEHAITKINYMYMYYEKLTQVNWMLIVCLHVGLLEMSSMISFSSIMLGVCRKQGMGMRVSLSALFLIRLICSIGLLIHNVFGFFNLWNKFKIKFPLFFNCIFITCSYMAEIHSDTSINSNESVIFIINTF